MVEPSFRTLLVAAIGAAPLMEPGLIAAGQAAIALSAITTRTEKKQRATIAAQANPPPENHFARNRHASSQAGLDTSNGSVAPQNQFECGGLTKVAIQEPQRFRRRGSFLLPAFHATLHCCAGFEDDRTDDRAFGG
jgi:hypothetical protein